MKKALLALLFLLATPLVHAQNPQTSLLAQSPDAATVKLMWFLDSWDAKITGFDVKRRESGGQWVQLNKAPIVPEISPSKDLSIVEADPGALQALIQKQDMLLSSRQIRVVERQAYAERLNTDDKALGAVALMIALDYDLALINGFGFIDRTATAGKNYEYGVFATGFDNPLAQTSVRAGEGPDLNLIRQATIKSTARRGVFQLIWKVDSTKLQATHLSGFNIYRNEVKLNKRAVMSLSRKGVTTEFTWFDSSGSKQEATYRIAPVTMFGIEGSGFSFQHDPTLTPSDYISPEVTEVKALKEDYSTGVQVSWKFSMEDERYIDGFIVYKSNLPEGYIAVSELQSPTTRSFVDRTTSAIGSYVKYQIRTVYKDETVISSGEELFYWFPMIKPAQPQNLRASWRKHEDGVVVRLEWDKSTDTLTAYYHLYASNPIDGEIYLDASIPPIRETYVDYKLNYGAATTYRFAVAGVSNQGLEGALSDTAIVVTPSLRLPFPAITSLALDSTQVRIRWEFPQVPDLKGFRVYQNGNMVSSEFQTGKELREFLTPPLKIDARYSFSVQAVTESGVESGKSAEQFINIQPPQKQ